jgi:hypothetical protein
VGNGNEIPAGKYVEVSKTRSRGEQMKRINNMTLLLTSMSILVLVIAACGAPATVPPSGSAQGTTGTAEVRATDAPPTGVTKIMVTANNIQVHNAAAAEDTWVTLIDKAITFDLVAIQGVEMLLGTKDIAEGKYTQIRLDVSKVVVTIQGKDYDAKLPGEKLKVVQPWEIKAGQKTILTLDFDADKFVVVTGQNDVQVKPVIKLDVTQGDRPLKKSSTPATGVKFDFSSVTKSAGPNDPVNVTAQTEPNAECSIEFFYSNGNKSNLIFPTPNNVKKADASGKIQFDGAMYRQVTTGTATIQVSVNSSGKTGVFKTTIEVVATSLSPGQASPAPSPTPTPTPTPSPAPAPAKPTALFIDVGTLHQQNQVAL